jgi:hypothetical protein
LTHGFSWAALLALAPSVARADGVVVRVGAHDSTVLALRSERAVVDASAGRETLYVAVALADSIADAGDRPLLWVMPLPAAAADVKAELAGALPATDGEDAAAWARDALRSTLVLMLATQIWSAPLAVAGLTPRHVTSQYDADRSTRPAVGGTSLDVLDAASLAPLRAHLQGLGADLGEAAAAVLERSTQPGHVFVACFVRDPAAAWPGGDRANEFPELALRASFPAATEEVPLVAGDALSRYATAVSVTTLGFTTARGAPPKELGASYRVRASSPSGASGRPGRATYFEWAAPSSRAESKLTFAPGVPAFAGVAASLLESSLGRLVIGGIGLLLFGVLAAAATVIALPILPRPARPPLATAAALGLLHLGTVVAPLVVFLRRARRFGTSRAWAAGFVFVSSVVLVMLTAVAIFFIRRLAE